MIPFLIRLAKFATLMILFSDIWISFYQAIAFFQKIVSQNRRIKIIYSDEKMNENKKYCVFLLYWYVQGIVK